MRPLALTMCACTGATEDSGQFVANNRDLLSEECSVWTGMVGAGTTWTYAESAAAATLGLDIEAVARVTYVDGPAVKVEWLRTITTGVAPTGDTGGDSGGTDSGGTDSGSDSDTTTTHETTHYSCEPDGLYLVSHAAEQYAGGNMAGGAASEGKRTFNPPALVLPFDPQATAAWTGSFLGESNFAGESAALAYEQSCVASAATASTGLGSLEGVEVTCTSNDGNDAHGHHGWYASNAGLVLDDSIVLTAYAP
jgi:hypothetical protein